MQNTLQALDTAFAAHSVIDVCRALDEAGRIIHSSPKDYHVLTHMSSLQSHLCKGITTFLSGHSHLSIRQIIKISAKLFIRNSNAHVELILAVTSGLQKRSINAPPCCVEYASQIFQDCIEYIKNNWTFEKCIQHALSVLKPAMDYFLLGTGDILDFQSLSSALAVYSSAQRNMSSVQQDYMMQKCRKLLARYIMKEFVIQDQSRYCNLLEDMEEQSSYYRDIPVLDELVLLNSRNYFRSIRYTMLILTIEFNDAKLFNNMVKFSLLQGSMEQPAADQAFFHDACEALTHPSISLIHPLFKEVRIESWKQFIALLQFRTSDQSMKNKNIWRDCDTWIASQIISSLVSKLTKKLLARLLEIGISSLKILGHTAVNLESGVFELYALGPLTRNESLLQSPIQLLSIIDDTVANDRSKLTYIMNLFKLISLQISLLGDFNVGSLSVPGEEEKSLIDCSISTLLQSNWSNGTIPSHHMFPIDSCGKISLIFTPSQFLNFLGDTKNNISYESIDLLFISSVLPSSSNFGKQTLLEDCMEIFSKYSSMQDQWIQNCLSYLSQSAKEISAISRELFELVNLLPTQGFSSSIDVGRHLSWLNRCQCILYIVSNFLGGIKSSSWIHNIENFRAQAVFSSLFKSYCEDFHSILIFASLNILFSKSEGIFTSTQEDFSHLSPENSCFVSISFLQNYLHLYIAPLLHIMNEFLSSKKTDALKRESHFLKGYIDIAKCDWAKKISKLSHFGDVLADKNLREFIENMTDKVSLIGAHSGYISLSKVTQSGLLFLVRGKRPRSMRHASMFESELSSIWKGGSSWGSALAQHASLEITGNHRVLSMCGLHFKLYPEAPGYEHAAGLFSRLLYGPDSGQIIPMTEFARLDIESDERGKRVVRRYPVTITSSCPGKSLIEAFQHDVQLLQQVDFNDFSNLAILCMLLKPEDAKPENLKVHSDRLTGVSRLSMISNERLFIHPTVTSSRSRTCVKQKCVLFCMDQMHKPIHPRTRQALLMHNVFEFVDFWLLNIQIMDAEHQSSSFFSIDESQWLFDLFCSQDPNSTKDSKKWEEARFGCCIPFLAGKMTVRDLVNSFTRLQNALLDSSTNPSLFDLLFLIDPPLANAYQSAIAIPQSLEPDQIIPIRPQSIMYKNPSNIRHGLEIIARFVRLTDGEYNANRSVKLNPMAILSSAILQLNQISPQELKKLKVTRMDFNPLKIHNTLWGFVAPSVLLHHVYELQIQDSHLNASVELLKTGSFNQFNDCIPALQERILLVAPIGYLSTYCFKSFLERVRFSDIRHLSLSDSSDIDLNYLKRILSSTTNVISLDVSGCKELDGTQIISTVSPLCPFLKHLKMNRLENLRDLSNFRWNGLSIGYEADSIEIIEAEENSISTLDLRLTKLSKLNLNCSKRIFLDLVSLRKLATENLTELMLDGWSTIQSVDQESELFPVLPNLIVLSLRFCPKLRSVVFGPRNIFCPILQILFTDGCSNLQQIDVFYLSHIISISSSDCPQLHKIGLCPQSLQSANLSQSHQISLEVLTVFLSSGWNLKSLCVDGNPNASEDLISSLKSIQYMWKLSQQYNLAMALPILQAEIAKAELVDSLTSEKHPRGKLGQVALRVSGSRVLKSFIISLLIRQHWISELLSIDFGFLRHYSLSVTDDIVSGVSHQCSNLQFLSLKNCPCITNSAMQVIGFHCIHLYGLDISWCTNIDDTGLMYLTVGTLKLKFLSVAGLFRISDQSLGHVSVSFPSLQSLNLSSCSRLSDAGVSLMCRSCVLMKQLDLSRCQSLTDLSLAALSSNIVGLISLDISECCSLTPLGIRNYLRSETVQNLRVLRLSGMSHLRAMVFDEISVACHKLRFIDLEDCIEISEQCIAQIIRRNKLLRHIDLRRCGNVTDQLLGYLAQNCSQLECLLISHSTLVSDSGLLEISKHCHYLSDLWVEECPRVTNSSLLMLASCCPNMQSMIIRGCKEITSAACQKIQWIRPNCHIMWWQ